MNLKLDTEFARLRKVLASRRKQLTQLGMGNKPNATRPLEDLEVDKLYKKWLFWNTFSPSAATENVVENNEFIWALGHMTRREN